MYTITCPDCGNTVKVPAGHHVIAQTRAPGGQHPGIAIDGKAVHRCGLDVPTPTR